MQQALERNVCPHFYAVVAARAQHVLLVVVGTAPAPQAGLTYRGLHLRAASLPDVAIASSFSWPVSVAAAAAALALRCHSVTLLRLLSSPPLPFLALTSRQLLIHHC